MSKIKEKKELVNSQVNILDHLNDLPKQVEYELPDMVVEVFDQIYTTYEYSIFKLIKTNRSINAKNRAKILRSSKRKQLVEPINVTIQDGNLYIVDGQHRYSVWKELGQPIYFMVNPKYSEFEMKEMNLSGVIWNKGTFLESHIKAGKEPYIEFKSIMDKNGFSIDLLLSIFNHFQVTDLEQIQEAFKEGNLTLNAMEDIEEFIFFYTNFAAYTDFKKNNFIKALMKVYDNKDVDRQYLLRQYQKHNQSLKPVRQGSIRKYIGTIINDVYSVQAPQSKALYYNVEKGRFHK